MKERNRMKDFWGILLAIIVVAAIWVIANNGFAVSNIVNAAAGGFNNALLTATGQVSHEGSYYA
ncbi:MAG: hypothetical protein QXI12_06645 [Candidatus Methanomethyliaceae archaeon]